MARPIIIVMMNHSLEIEINAMSIGWNRWEMVYLFPPATLLPQVLAKLEDFRGRGVLVAPFYPQAGWFPALLELFPGPLPEDYALWQDTSKGRVWHPLPQVFKLHAWRL